MPYNKTMIDSFRDIKSHATSIDTEPNTLNVYFLLDNAITDIILRDKKCFSYLGHVMTKYITTIRYHTTLKEHVFLCLEVYIYVYLDLFIH